MRFRGLEGWLGRADLAGSARLELVSGVVQLRPEDAMFEAMLRGWRAQQVARGLREDTIAPRERLVRRFGEFTREYPWQWSPGHMDEWSLHLTAEEHLAPSTIRSYQCTLRQFTEFLVDGRYGWAAACEEAFGPGRHPVAICHEWNTIAHLNDYEGEPGGAAVHPRGDAAVPGLRRRAGGAGGERASGRAPWRLTGTRPCSRSCTGGGCGAPRRRSWTWRTGAATRRPRSSAGTAC